MTDVKGMLRGLKEEWFIKKMEVLGYLIRVGRPVRPKEIYENTGVKHYPTINYHLKRLVEEGVVIPLRGGRYMVQPFIANRSVDALLEEAVNQAFSQVYIDHFKVPEEEKVKVKVKAFINSFLTYLAYLLYTGDFAGSEPPEANA